MLCGLCSFAGAGVCWCAGVWCGAESVGWMDDGSSNCADGWLGQAGELYRIETVPSLSKTQHALGADIILGYCCWFIASFSQALVV